MKIYLAGKVGKNCWRHDVVDGLRDERWMTAEHPANQEWPVLERAVLEQFDYTGPYFTSCDHGCAHGDTWKPTGEEFVGGLHGLAVEMCQGPPLPALVRSLCLGAIQRSDVVFAWIDAPDCYGTLVELGYAHAAHVPLIIATQKGFDASEMWFVLSCGLQLAGFKTPVEALRYFAKHAKRLMGLTGVLTP